MLLAILKIRSASDVEVRAPLASYETYSLCITAIDPKLSDDIDRAIGSYLRREISLKEFKEKMRDLLDKAIDQIEESVCIPNGDLDDLNLDAEPEDFEVNKLYNVIETYRDAEAKGYLVRVEDWQDYIKVRASLERTRDGNKEVTTVKWVFEPLDTTIIIERRNEVELDTDGAYDPDDDMLL